MSGLSMLQEDVQQGRYRGSGLITGGALGAAAAAYRASLSPHSKWVSIDCAVLYGGGGIILIARNRLVRQWWWWCEKVGVW